MIRRRDVFETFSGRLGVVMELERRSWGVVWGEVLGSVRGFVWGIIHVL